MKIRTGFVSNSSSSSFVCDVCGNIESGWDQSPEDLGMTTCKNGHVMCDCHVEGYTPFKDTLDTKEKLVEYLKANWTSNWEADNLKEALTQIEEAGDNFEEVRDEIMENEEFASGPSEEDCPICSMKELQEETLLKYLYKTRDIKINDIKKEIKERFTTLKELEEFVKD